MREVTSESEQLKRRIEAELREEGGIVARLLDLAPPGTYGIRFKIQFERPGHRPFEVNADLLREDHPEYQPDRTHDA